MRDATISLLCLFVVACGGDDSGASPNQRGDAGAGGDAATRGSPSDADAAGDRAGQDASSSADASGSPPDAASGDAAAPSPGLALRLALDAHYRDCMVISAGELYDIQERSRFLSDERGECSARCDLNADCSLLHAYLCGGVPDSALMACYEACSMLANPSGFSCTPTGPVVRQNQRCDDRSDCPNNQDEIGCGSYRCADGQVLDSAHSRCNFLAQCHDGSDELGCATRCPS